MNWFAGVWVSAIVKKYSLAVVEYGTCGSGTGAPRKCRLLWLMINFCSALYTT